jgi:hypothetical protein
MSGREAIQNQTVSLFVQFFGGGGAPEVGTLLSGTLTIGSGSPITCAINGQTLLATVPFDQSLGLTTFLWQWSQIVQSVTSSQSVSYAVTIISQPSGSSQSYVPANVSRQCLRLCEPDDRTVEQFILTSDPRNPTLAIYLYGVPYNMLRSNVANFPSTGPDLVSISYIDSLGQGGVLTINCVLWMSDNGYCMISADNGWQFYFASIRGDFWQANAETINTRNSNAGATALMPCLNAVGYDFSTLLPNQLMPNLQIDNGVTMTSGSAIGPNVV